jgi:1-acyl-sn-glycerol-3-phosphate acyltransferase
MLTPRFYADYRVLPTPWCYQAVRALFTANAGLARTRFRVEGLGDLPRRPVLFATNSTQKNDFMAFRWVMMKARLPCVTVTKAKNYHDPVMGFLLGRLGVVPLASRGYFLLLDFTQTIGRRPSDDEYRALRDHLDRGVPLPAGQSYERLATRARALLEHQFAPAAESYRAFLERVYARSLGESLRLTGEAARAGHHIQMYPEGTVAPQLGRGRPGAVQLAWALGLPIVPVGMSGCPAAFAGDSPFLRLGGGDVTVRFGHPLALPADLLPPGFRPFEPADEAAHRTALSGFTEDTLMPAIDELLEPPFRRAHGEVPAGKGTRAFL